MRPGYCGNAIAPGGVLLTPTSTPNNYTCKMRCQGAGAEICGGSSALSLYNNTNFTPPEVPASIGKYKTSNLSCVTDPNTNGRALQGNRTVSTTGMSVEYCVKFCLGSYYHYAA